jgi:hypothetical protein
LEINISNKLNKIKYFKSTFSVELKKQNPNFQPTCKENARGNIGLEIQQTPIKHNKEH